MSLVLVQGDTAPTLTGVITDDATGEPLDLTDCTVYFQMRQENDRRFTVNGSCTVTSALDGEVEYTLGANDLNTPGTYQTQFEVHYGDGKVQTTWNTNAVTVRRQ